MKIEANYNSLNKIILTLTLVLWSNLVLGQDKKDELKDLIIEHVAKSYDSCNVELMSYVTNPSNPNQKIIVVPKIIEVNNMEGYTKYQVYLLLINQKGSLLTKFIDPVLYYSDASRLYSIAFDTANYSIKPELNAFGLRFNYEGSSSMNPSESEHLNLYYIHENQIFKILDDFYTLIASGENNQGMNDSFESEYTETKRILIPTKFKENSFADFIIKEKKEVLVIKNEKETEKQFPYQKTGILQYDAISKQYKFIKSK
jgi:hypothetical protein